VVEGGGEVQLHDRLVVIVELDDPVLQRVELVALGEVRDHHLIVDALDEVGPVLADPHKVPDLRHEWGG
jgi:hypothetical protein